MIEQTINQRGTTLVRRLFLAPGEATRWHRDPFHRLSIVFTSEVLAIEFRDGSPSQHVRVAPGQVDWEAPSERIHRAINIGDKPYEEITIFFPGPPRVTSPSRMLLNRCSIRMPVEQP